jgi:transposase
MAGGRPLRIAWAAEDTSAALQRAYRAERDRHVALRLHALWLLREGHALRETARLTGAGERALQRWVAWYRTEGLAGVRAHRLAGTGRAAFLTRAQQQAVRAHLASGAVHTAQDASSWIAAQFGVTYRPKGIYGLLHRLRARPKVPRPSNPKSDAAVQAAWKKGGSALR